jgi:glycosyltransferase involved in cell wall biosynthesis
MRVALLTTGRFTLVDLARELAALGHEPLVYSLVPGWRTERFGLSRRHTRWLGAYVAPLYAAVRLARGRRARAIAMHALDAAVDAVAAALVEPCDVLVGMSGIALRTVDAVHRRYGATVFLERSSRHILSQRAILEAIPGSGPEPVPAASVRRELAGYERADVVSVPARHVAESFLERGFPEERLFVNPFGVDLEVFQPTPAPARPPTVVTTGAWSLQKGSDVLVEAWRGLPAGTRLLHVGPVVDVPLPRDPHFTHVDAVPQNDLPRYYAQGHVFAMASRQEGLALVQVQALACGLQLVCTSRTGGADLSASAAAPGAVRVVPPDDPARLRDAIAAALADLPPPGTPRDLLGAGRATFSWRAYAERYAARMQEALARRGGTTPAHAQRIHSPTR